MNSNRSLLQVSEGYQFTASNDTYSHLLLCKICNKLMIEPSRLYPCGHTFCKSCILQHNKNISQNSRQNKCFIPFPQCGKYYITLQPDLLAASLINDLQVKCLSEGCPWTGSLQRFKISHKNLCKLREGGLSTWLNDFNQGVKSIKKIRNERKKNLCIDIDQNDEAVVLNQNLNRKTMSGEGIKNSVGSSFVASDGPSCQKDSCHHDKQQGINKSHRKNDHKQSFEQKSIFLGINKKRVGDQRKLQINQLEAKIINLDDDQIDADQTQEQKANNFNKDFSNKKNDSTEIQKRFSQNYTGLKMINSYKKKSQKIAQNPNNMSLTRSQPQIREHQHYQNLL